MSLKNKSKSTRPISEQYCIRMAETSPTHFTMIPNFLSKLTYDSIDKKTGKKVVKRLSAVAKCLYLELCATVSGHGKCWKNRDTLANDANISAGSVTNAKKELTEKFHQLDGGSLIIIEEKSKASKKNGSDYHLITICNVWGFNSVYYLLRDNNIDLSTMAPSSPDDAYSAPSGDDDAPQGAPSLGDTNKKNKKKNPLFKEQEPKPNGDPVVSLKKKDFVSSFDEMPSYQFLIKTGFTPKAAKDIVSKYSDEEIKKASHYMAKQMQKMKLKGKPIDDHKAYFVSTLKNKYYEDKK